MDLRPATTGIIMADGSALTLCLTFPALYRLKSVRPKEYKQINQVLLHGAEDVLDYLTLAYGGYLCANLDNLDGDGKVGVLTWSEFLELAPAYNEVVAAANSLVAPKKRAASATHSGERPAGGEKAE